MDLLQGLVEELRPVVYTGSLDPVLVPISESLGRVSSRDIYSEVNKKWLTVNRKLFVLRGNQVREWRIVSNKKDFVEGTAILITHDEIEQIDGDYYLELSDCPHLYEARSIHRDKLQAFIHPITKVKEGTKIVGMGEEISLEMLISLSMAGIESIWVYEAPRVYLVYETENVNEVPVMGALVSSMITRFGADLVEVVVVPPKFSLVKSAIASTFPDADLILIGGATEEHISRYNSSLGSQVDLKFIGNEVNLSMVDGVPALWLSGSISKCITTCQLVIASILFLIRGVTHNYRIESVESAFELSVPHRGVVVPVKQVSGKIQITENYSRVYGYVIVPPDQEIKTGEKIQVYRIKEL